MRVSRNEGEPVREGQPGIFEINQKLNVQLINELFILIASKYLGCVCGRAGHLQDRY